MKMLITVIVVVTAIVGITMAFRIGRSSLGPGTTPDGALTLEQKLETLARYGLELASPFTVTDLVASWPRGAFEKPGFDLTLVGLGMTEQQEPWRNHCVNLWHFDTECIEDQGDYKRIVERMAEMTQGSLALTDIQDHVDIEAEQAWFSFSCQGKNTRVVCKVNDDWVDTDIFATFVRLLNAADPSQVYIYYDLGGQDGLIGCVSKEDLRGLNREGIKFVPLP